MPETLALAWPRSAEDPLRGVVVDGAGKVGAAFETAAPVTSDGLKAALAKAKVTAKRTVVAVPRSRATIRRLDLPAVPDDDLPDLVRMQAATKSAAPLDQLAFDFLPVPASSGAAGRAALLATIPAKLLAEISKTTEAAGLNLASVGLAPVGAARLVSGQAPGEGTTLIVSRDGEFVELTLLAFGPDGPRVTNSHSAHPVGQDEEEWERTLLSECSRVLISHSSDLEDGLATVWGLGAESHRWAPRLAERLGGTPRPVEAWSELGLSGPSSTSAPGSLGGAVGLATGDQAVPALNFLAPRRRPEPEDTRLRTGLLAATALAIVVGGGWFVLSRQKANLQEQIAVLETRIASDEKFVKRNEPLLVEDAALSLWAAETTDSRTELARLDALLPGTDRLFLESFQLSPPTSRSRASIRADGFAESTNLVREVERDLAGAGYVVRPTQTARVTGREGYPVRFSLTAELPPEPAPSASAPTETAAANAGGASL
ncbi:type IV pilus biogenesis protein PilM [Alienimonas californiensis]|uniref:Competence protein A n=1 Tax=Alienimonas californiensis TaxID=2527989 RepID=A0A517PDW6_9PLAN|nr:hypothetical protein [Alienimonas californiensis]QDT17570.1 hypothetical protein CA12_36980 [Alienimonas californiensis]